MFIILARLPAIIVYSFSCNYLRNTYVFDCTSSLTAHKKIHHCLPKKFVMARSNGTSSAPTSAATKLRRMIEDPSRMVVCPGVYDGFSARIALEVGFDALYMVRSF